MAAKGILRADLKLAFRWPFLLAILGVVLGFCFDNFESLRISSWSNPYTYVEGSVACVMYYVFNSFSFGGVFSGYFSPMLAAIPYGCSYCIEKQGGLWIYKAAKCGNRAYVRSKFLTAALCGGLTLALGGLLFMLVLSGYLPIVTPQKILESEWIPYFDALILGDGRAYLAIILYLSFLGGCLWASVGLLASAWYPSPYVAISAPFVFVFLLMQIGRMLRLPNNFRLEMLLIARGEIYSTPVTLAVLTAAVTGLCLLFCHLFLRKFERGLQNAA